MKGVRIYDNENKTYDRYTAVFAEKINGEYVYLAMSEHPFHPQGFGQHGFNHSPVDRPTSKHLGKRIKFEALPIGCQEFVLEELKP
jgi:hypothetical protein